MSTISKKISNLSASPGVYLFKDKAGDILYIGKAASLKSRVRSYFGSLPPLIPPSGRRGRKSEIPSGRGGIKKEITSGRRGNRPIEFVMDQVVDFEVKRTDSVIEAYFLEQELIKKHQPKYNVLGKDDKSFVYVCVTKEEFPRFEIKRKTDLERITNYKLQITNKNQIQNSKFKRQEYCRIYGPYGARHQVEKALKILRRIFPYHNRKQQTEKGCLDYQIGLCPGPYEGRIAKAEYAKNIRGIELMFKGKKKMLVKKLEQEMKEFGKRQEFEKAAERRNQVFALKHIQDIALISDRNEKFNPPVGGQNSKFFRVEAYDISNISGKFCVGSMVVFDNSSGEFEANKSQYRKFKIKTVQGIDDVAAMREVLARRFRNDWQHPELVMLDGGKGHLNMAEQLFEQLGVAIPIVAVAKGPTRKSSDFKPEYSGQISKNQKQLIQKITGDKNILGQIMGEAHRFAISYHRKLRGKGLRGD